MDRESFVNKIKEKHKLTQVEQTLINGMNFIQEYFRPVAKALKGSNIDHKNFDYRYGANYTLAIIRQGEQSLSFQRTDNLIKVTDEKHNNIDNLVTKSSNLISEKFSIPLSEQLMDNYLSLLFD